MADSMHYKQSMPVIACILPKDHSSHHRRPPTHKTQAHYVAHQHAPHSQRHTMQVSGRTWKAPARRAGEVMKPQVGSSWEKKMQQRASRQQFLDFKREAVEAAKEKRKVLLQCAVSGCETGRSLLQAFPFLVPWRCTRCCRCALYQGARQGIIAKCTCQPDLVMNIGIQGEHSALLLCSVHQAILKNVSHCLIVYPTVLLCTGAGLKGMYDPTHPIVAQDMYP
eukprot:1140640-Pelagomonas_calceolata.AAC.9